MNTTMKETFTMTITYALGGRFVQDSFPILAHDTLDADMLCHDSIWDDIADGAYADIESARITLHNSRDIVLREYKVAREEGELYVRRLR